MSAQMSQPISPAIRRMPRVFLLLALSWALLVGPATTVTAGLMVGLMNTVIGIGGAGDSTSANIPAKLNGTVVPPGYTYVPINYPASIQLSASTAISGPLVYNAVTSRPAEQLIVAGYSEGSLGAEAAKRQLLANNSGPAASQLSFLMMGSPFAGNGGIFARFPGLSVPFIVTNMGPAQASQYNSTFVTNEYDPYGDFPAYFNPLSLANSLLAVRYAHPDPNYDSYVPGVTPAIVTTVTNSAGGQDTYVFINNPNLPLLAPLRDAAGAIGLTPLAKPVLDAVEPLLRVLVDMGYTDRQNLNPAAPTPFSLFTPLPKIIEALNAVPGALSQGVTNFITDVQSELPAPLAATPVSPLAASAKAPPVALTPLAAVAQEKSVAVEPNKAPVPPATPTSASTPNPAPAQPKSPAPEITSSTTQLKPATAVQSSTHTDTPSADKASPDPGTPKSTKSKKNTPGTDAETPKLSSKPSQDGRKSGPSGGAPTSDSAAAHTEKSAA
ncbi:MAG: PE-PPE domain-containing protein [Mycobacterium sp.]|nr:PE-PPE domain-containing protein [Mycobacterium sp.]